MALSLERYLVIRHPVTSRRISTTSRVRGVIASIWMTSCGAMLPLAVVRSIGRYPLTHEDDLVTMCHELWPGELTYLSFEADMGCVVYQWGSLATKDKLSWVWGQIDGSSRSNLALRSSHWPMSHVHPPVVHSHTVSLGLGLGITFTAESETETERIVVFPCCWLLLTST